MLVRKLKQSVGKLMNSTIEYPDFTKRIPFPIRHLEFKFDGQNFYNNFYRNAELASAYVTAMSIFLTYGEELVIETARYHRDFVNDPILKQRVTALIGQEAIHSKVHNAFNDQTLANHQYPVRFYRFLAENVFKYGFHRFPQPLKLSLMAGIEHFTAVFAEFAMKHDAEIWAKEIDDKTKGLWMWHFMEESEHKDVAYDVFQLISGNYTLRITGFFLASFTIMGLVFAGAVGIPILRRPLNAISPRYWKDVAYSLNVLWNPQNGVFGSTVGHVMEYLRLDFHPNDHDTTAYLQDYKQKLLNPETGLLIPYFTKEFMPKIQAA
ncbi:MULTISPECIES: metal-dependent hydrolase [unclassified Acinetobacter]|uniref:metal-dependent hydrolase n=1 Tax=unclassified Acinetobacter TaxID=196816 RepID=UPI002446945F|nr:MULTISPECIES: metal-dependent hydrolase [unclassified Acinetobacter]MDH0031134.1 metal-dependent hydrolase [Acinetobacter sp. GD04021]MDH0886720.1 metal-dependent hydrolase [Acinetobacter sp. GD03873]MDH1083147.1 metal-dependent hydrolase [Acinetobacter sp. GD03983]MDH2189340.1 metal-dependent hydrolase [Acinetobacter sp. GD03645]MDH2202853.1 metal-dependent hydrolase [Acinetobacter sp. GD03647]